MRASSLTDFGYHTDVLGNIYMEIEVPEILSWAGSGVLAPKAPGTATVSTVLCHEFDETWMDFQCDLWLSMPDGNLMPEEVCDMGLDGLNLQAKAALFAFYTGPADVLRDLLDAPILRHDGYRPAAYNKLVGGAPGSAHMSMGPWAALDFEVAGLTCDDVRATILNRGLVEMLGLRMEDRPGSNWVHIDNHPVGSQRFFKP